MYNKKMTTYKKKDNTIAKLAKTVKTLAIRDKPETKYAQGAASANTVSPAGSSFNVCLIGSGPGQQGRIGTKIRVHEININIATQFQPTAVGIAKYYLVQDLQQVASTNALYGDVFELNVAPLLEFQKIENMRRFKILKRLTVNVDSNNPLKTIYRSINWKSKLGVVQEYGPSLVFQNIIKNGFYLMCITDEIGTTVTEIHAVRNVYTDV